MKTLKLMVVLAALLLIWGNAAAQTVEIYAGHQRAGVDLMWFKSFKNAKDARTPFLFFSRTRASRIPAYRDAPDNAPDNAPTLFGSTSAVSYNFKSGIGIVVVGSLLNTSFTPKTGIQYYTSKGDFMFFGWLVADIKESGNLDLFGMFRYQPVVSGHWRLFSQLELFPVYHPGSGYWNLTQRLRLGGKYHAWAAGAMTDFNQSGSSDWTYTRNIGGFVRYDF